LISEWRNKKHYNIQTVKISNFCSLNIALINSQSDQQKDRLREKEKYKILPKHAVQPMNDMNPVITKMKACAFVK